MVGIPENNYNMENDVDKAVAAIVEFMKTDRWKKGYGADVLKLNHGTRYMEPYQIATTEPVAREVAARFKAKGYYAHFCVATTGRIFKLVITREPTEWDI